MACHGMKLGRKFFGLSRFFSSSSSFSSKEREARMLAKLLADKGDKKFWRQGSIKTVSGSVDKVSKRRATALNKMFLVQISEAMLYGKAAEKIAGRGIEITKVQVVSNYRQVNVFWICKESEPFLEVQEDLKSISGLIRQDLMYSNVMGNVPLINFVRDVKTIELMQTDDMLVKLSLTIEKDEKNLGECLSFDQSEKEEQEQVSNKYGFEPMMMNTLGLRHDIILSRIKDSKSKRLPVNMPDPNLSTGDDTKFQTQKPVFDRKKEIKQFIQVFNREKSQAWKSVQKNQHESLFEEENEGEEFEGEEFEGEDFEGEDVDYRSGVEYDQYEDNEHIQRSARQGSDNINEEIDPFDKPKA